MFIPVRDPSSFSNLLHSPLYHSEPEFPDWPEDAEMTTRSYQTFLELCQTKASPVETVISLIHAAARPALGEPHEKLHAGFQLIWLMTFFYLYLPLVKKLTGVCVHAFMRF